MTVKEIFDHPAVKAVEMEILDTIRDEERCRSCRNGEDTRLAVQHLLSVRKRILNGMFEWADEYYSLLSEFNNVLVEAQCEMRERLFRLSENVKETENWNEGLDKEKTIDMKLCYAFHNINTHTAFSIFDLLWVRDFYIARDTANGNAGYYLRISPRWYRCIGLLVPRGAEAWYRTYRPDGTGTKVPIYTLSKGAVRTVPHGTLR